VTGSDLEVTSFDGSHLKVTVEGGKLAYTVHFTCYKTSSQEELVTLQEIVSRVLRWQEVTRKRRHLTGSHLKAAVGGRKLI